MADGIQVFRDDGALVFDSDSRAFGVYDVFYIDRNTAGSKGYPELAGYTIDVHAVMTTNLYGLFGNAPRQFSIGYSNGYPVVYWAYNQNYASGSLNYAQMRVVVVIKTAPARNDYGFLVVNDESELVSSDFVRSYAYVGDAWVVSHANVNEYADSTMECDISSTNLPIVFVQNIEGQVAAIVRIYWTGSTWRIRIVKTSNSIPRVLCFDQSTSPGSGHGMQVFDGSGQVVFDSTKRLMSTRAYANYTLPPTSYSGSGVFFRLPGTTYLSSAGSIPSNSASFCPGQAFHGGEAISGGNVYVKWLHAGIKKQGGSMYSGWVIESWSTSSYNTFFPITQASNLNRIHIIDADRY